MSREESSKSRNNRRKDAKSRASTGSAATPHTTIQAGLHSISSVLDVLEQHLDELAGLSDESEDSSQTPHDVARIFMGFYGSLNDLSEGTDTLMDTFNSLAEESESGLRITADATQYNDVGTIQEQLKPGISATKDHVSSAVSALEALDADGVTNNSSGSGEKSAKLNGILARSLMSLGPSQRLDWVVRE